MTTFYVSDYEQITVPAEFETKVITPPEKPEPKTTTAEVK